MSRASRLNKFSLLIVFTVLSVMFLPPFIYNELEYRFRNEFWLALFNLDDAEYGIQLRQSYVTDDYQELVEVGDLVEKNIEEAIHHIEKAQSYNKKQDFLVVFMGNKYKTYHNKKINAVNGYDNLVKEYFERKRKEHLSSNTLSLVFHTQQEIGSMKNQEDWWNTIDNLSKTVQTVRDNSAYLLSESMIDEDIYNYYQSETERFMFMYDQSQNVIETHGWDSFDAQGLMDLSEKDIDVYQVFSNTQLQWKEQADQQEKRFAQNDEVLHGASDYYNENMLADDKISMMLSLVSDIYPRMKIDNDGSSGPTIIPQDTNPELLSAINTN